MLILIPLGLVCGGLIFPPLLGLLGFSFIGPAAGSFAAWGIGGAGGGALYLWSVVQSIAMIPYAALQVGAVIGTVIGTVFAFFF